MSNSLQLHGLEPTRLLCSWDFPGKDTGVDCHSLLQGIFLTQGSNPCLLHQESPSGFFTNEPSAKPKNSHTALDFLRLSDKHLPKALSTISTLLLVFLIRSRKTQQVNSGLAIILTWNLVKRVSPGLTDFWTQPLKWLLSIPTKWWSVWNLHK